MTPPKDAADLMGELIETMTELAKGRNPLPTLVTLDLKNLSILLRWRDLDAGDAAAVMDAFPLAGWRDMDHDWLIGHMDNLNLDIDLSTHAIRHSGVTAEKLVERAGGAS